MKKIETNTLLQQLEGRTRQLILQATRLLHEDPEMLLQQPAPGKWSAAQAIEHLNSYGRYYLPELEKAIRNSTLPAATMYKPGMLGNYFTHIMSPDKKGEVSNKMASPKGHRPPPDLDSKTVLDEFLAQHHRLLELLHAARATDIGRLRIPVSIARFIRLKAGDTCRFLLAHEERHFVQVNNALQAVKMQKESSGEKI